MVGPAAAGGRGALTPGGSSLAALPALAGALAGLAHLALRGGAAARPSPAGTAVLTVGAAVAVLVLVPTS